MTQNKITIKPGFQQKSRTKDFKKLWLFKAELTFPARPLTKVYG